MTYQNIPLLITLLAVLMFSGILIKFIIDANKERSQRKLFDEQLKSVVTNGTVVGPKTKEKKEIKIDKALIPDLVRRAELAKETTSDDEIRSKAMLFAGSVFVILTVIFKNPFIGIVVIALAFGGLFALASKRENDKMTIMEDQIPAFVSILKANVQAGETPSKALSAAIDNTASPLYDELFMTKALIETGSFKSALTALRLKTKNESLRFLCSCIELSSDVGTNLEEQIEVIEEMLEDQKELDRKLTAAISENKPLALASALAIPGLFILLYAGNEIARDFWFKEPISWLLLIVVGVIYVASMLLANGAIKKVAKFK